MRSFKTRSDSNSTCGKDRPSRLTYQVQLHHVTLHLQLFEQVLDLTQTWITLITECMQKIHIRVI